MDIKELIERIETNKHDVTMNVRSIVLDPIERINRPGAATDSYFAEQQNNNQEILKKAEAIMSSFAKKWRNPDDTSEEQLQSMQSYIRKVVSDIIPQIKEVVRFYSLCVECKQYFTSTEKGDKALHKMTEAVCNSDRICNRLQNLYGNEKEETFTKHSCNLLVMLQKGLDAIDAEVTYKNEWENSEFLVQIDEEEFLDHVLINIRDNINRHAFGTPFFQNMYIWKKKVLVEIEQDKTKYIVKISNNGEPFTGNVKKVFEYGYCHGKMKHSGIGMHSIKQTMNKMGGDVEFETSTTPNFSTIYKILITR